MDEDGPDSDHDDGNDGGSDDHDHDGEGVAFRDILSEEEMAPPDHDDDLDPDGCDWDLNVCA